MPCLTRRQVPFEAVPQGRDSLGILNRTGGLLVLVPVAVAVEVEVAVLVAGGRMRMGGRQRVVVPVAVEVVVDVVVGVGPGGLTVDVPVVVLGGFAVDVLVAVVVLGGFAVDVVGGRDVVVVAGGGVAVATSVASGGTSTGSIGSSVIAGCSPSASMVEGGANVMIGGVSSSVSAAEAPRA